MDDIDNYTWQDCGGNNSLSFYPSANVQLNRKQFLVHFDTGAPFTFFSYEELLEAQLLRPGELVFTPCERGTIPYMAATLDVEVVLRCQATDQTKSIKLKGQIVRNWLNSPFRRHCSEQKCNQLSQIISDGKNCLVRIGLIGRNILTDNNLALVLDGSTRQTKFYINKDD